LKSHAYPLILILGIAFALRMLWVSQFHTAPRGEFLDVHIEALFNSIGRSTPRNYESPGYPFLVSLLYHLFGPNYRIIHFLNVCLGVLSCFLIYQLGQKIFIRRVGIIAGFLGAIHPGLVGLCTLLAYENLFIPLILAGMLSLIKENGRKTVVGFVPAGIFWASATLVRPTVMLFPFYLLVIYFRKYRRNKIYRKILAISFVTVLFVAGWIVRNYQTVKYAKLIRQAGIALWLGNNPTTYLGTGTKPKNLSTSIFLDWRDRRYLKKAVRQIINYPLQFLSKMAMKIENLFIDQRGNFSFCVAENYYESLSQKQYYDQAFYLDPLFRWFGYLLVAGLLVFSIESFTWEQPMGLLFHFILYWILVHSVFFARPRFRLSIDPFLIIITAVALLRLWSHITKKHFWSPAI
jgi:4-amino-4-deoxy-L-arabinose transferase-like glycosyltransferase